MKIANIPAIAKPTAVIDQTFAFLDSSFNLNELNNQMIRKRPSDRTPLVTQ